MSIPLKQIVLGACLSISVFANRAKAANQYFDVNGVTPGYGTVDGGIYSWDEPNWAAATGGTTATASWVAGNFARFPGIGNYTVTVTNLESMAGFVLATTNYTLTINAAGSGSLDVVPSGTLTTGLPAQGFFVTRGSSCIINAPITGTGAISLNVFNGGSATFNISLYGSNSYSGGTVLSSSSYLVFYNNNNSFGTGPININGTTFAPLLGTGGSPITLANNWTNIANGGVNFASDPNTPVTLSGPLALQTFNLNIRNNGNSTSPLTLSGIINGAGGTLNFSANNNGTVFVTGANTYTGPTTLGGSGSSGVTVSVGSLNKVSGGNPSSNLGAPTTVGNGTIGIGNGAVTSTLVYTGPGEVTDRVLNLLGTTGGANIQADGTGPLVFTSNNTATGSGAKKLTLQGTNTAANTIAGRIVDSAGGPTTVIKAQSGTWVLSGSNTFTGGIGINGGTLEIAAGGKVAGNITNNSGNLQLDSPTNLTSSANIALFSSLANGAVNLNFTGTQAINGLLIDGVLFTSGTWGSPASSAANVSPIFSGNGILSILGAPIIVEQPVPLIVYPETPNQSFSVVVAGDPSFTYQWKLNGTNIAGATDSIYTIPVVVPTDAGTYTVAITNNFGFTNSAGAALTVLPTNNYVNTIRTDTPVSYWRLGETNGTLAYDGIGGNVGRYVNALLNQPGFSLTDPDGSVGVPASSGRGYVIVTNFAPFVFAGAPAFSLEAWGYFTNLTGVQRIFSTLNLNNPNGFGFGINGANQMRFTAGAVADRDQPLNTSLVAGLWYHLVLTCDGSAYHFYVNGLEQGSGQPVASVNGVGVPLSIGCNPLGYTNNTVGDPLAEQVRGQIDEAAIYNYTLSPLQVTNHFAARYGTLAPPVVSTPVANPPSNYVSLSASIEAVAAGQALTYQWYKAPSTLLPGQTDDTLTLSPLQLSDAGNYFVQVTNPAGTSNSPTVLLTVLPIPTNAADLNLTNNLVVHLAFDNDYLDISGHSNNGTNVGATTFVSPGAVGTNALHYFTDTGSSSFNYVTLGVRPDLQFGTTVNFTVSYWIRQPSGSTFTNLPFFTDAIGSTGHGGFAFAPYQTATTSGGWQLTLGSMSSPSQFTSFPDADLINDGNWHHLVHSADRTANVTTYLDGKQVDSQSIVFIGNINTGNAATIGQDPTGTYPITASADIDDLAVWQRTVTPLEVSGIYLAGVSNNVSFAPPVVPSIVPEALSVQLISGQVVLTWPGAGGALQASGDVTGTYTNVPGASSPYTNTIAAPQLFYRLKY